MKYFIKKQKQPMFPWVEGTDMTDISVSQADLNNGSPKKGDMIAININNPDDKWLIAERFFKENYSIDVSDLDFKSRVEIEYAELEEKIKALASFLKQGRKKIIKITGSVDHFVLLTEQHYHMCEYAEILEERIKLFKNE
jgi:hypothetical protein